MRFLFSSTRGSGHFNPLVPYVHACRARGHEVAVAAPEEVAEKVAALGATFLPFERPSDDVLGPIWARVYELSGDDANDVVTRDVFARLHAGAALPGLCESIEDWKPDAVVRESFEFGSAVAAPLLRVPVARVGICLGHVEERALQRACQPVSALRESVGLPGDPEGEAMRSTAMFSAFPRSLEDMREPTPSNVRRVRPSAPANGRNSLPGSWWPAPQHPLVYVTFGTVAAEVPYAQDVYRATLDALAGLDARVLLTTGSQEITTALRPGPANARIETWVAQDRVFPEAAAIVCHGGSGTVTGALAAGLPLAVLPLFADQMENARRVEAVGAGIRVAGRPPSCESIRAAAEALLRRPRYTETAKALAREMATHLTMDEAIRELEGLALPRWSESPRSAGF